MSKVAFWERGEALDYVNGTNAVIEANTVLELGSRIAIAGMEMAVGEKGTVHVVGVYSFPKTDQTELSAGTEVYFDGSGITASADNGQTGDQKKTYVKAGYVTNTAAASATEVLVKINA